MKFYKIQQSLANKFIGPWAWAKSDLNYLDIIRERGDVRPLTLLNTDKYFFASTNPDKYYPNLSFMMKNLQANYNDYHLYDKVYNTEKYLEIPMWIKNIGINNVTLENLNFWIITHNSFFAKIPSENEFLKEKKSFMDIWAGNTPGLTGTMIRHTPLQGTLYDFNKLGVWTIYSKWIMSSYLLIWEFNFLNKVLLFLNNKSLNLPVTVQEESAFNFWLSRVISKHSYKLKDLFKKKTYLMDFSDDSMLIQVMEYLLHVSFNLYLSQKILNHMLLHKNMSPAIGRFGSWPPYDRYLDRDLFRELMLIIDDFHRENQDAENFIRELRLYRLNNYFTGQDFKDKPLLSSTFSRYLT